MNVRKTPLLAFGVWRRGGCAQKSSLLDTQVASCTLREIQKFYFPRFESIFVYGFGTTPSFSVLKRYPRVRCTNPEFTTEFNCIQSDEPTLVHPKL